MRVLVCFPEDAYLQWLGQKQRLLAEIAQLVPKHEHVAVQVGTFIQDPAALEAWLSCDTESRRKALRDGASFSVMSLAGASRLTAAELVRVLAKVNGVMCVSIATVNERFLLHYLESTLPARYRFVGSRLRVLHTEDALHGDFDVFENDTAELKAFDAFAEVELENAALTGTIFDEFSTPSQFDRQLDVARFANDAWQAEAVSTWLTVLEPRLKETLHAACERAETAVTKEQAAQAGLSCRRYLEQLADRLFPPRTQLHNGRKVTQDCWLNRLWAAMEERVGPVEEPEELLRLGAALDDVKGRADSAVHHQPAVPVDSMRAIVNDVIAFSDALRAQRDPEAARLEPYTEELNRFLREALGLGITE